MSDDSPAHLRPSRRRHQETRTPGLVQLIRALRSAQGEHVARAPIRDIAQRIRAPDHAVDCRALPARSARPPPLPLPSSPSPSPSPPLPPPSPLPPSTPHPHYRRRPSIRHRFRPVLMHFPVADEYVFPSRRPTLAACCLLSLLLLRHTLSHTLATQPRELIYTRTLLHTRRPFFHPREGKCCSSSSTSASHPVTKQPTQRASSATLFKPGPISIVSKMRQLAKRERPFSISWHVLKISMRSLLCNVRNAPRREEQCLQRWHCL